MARKVFFSFHFDRDAWRVAQVRNSNVVSGYEQNPFYDKADWEAIKKKGDAVAERWIDDQLKGTSVTVVLIGQETSKRRWVSGRILAAVAEVVPAVLGSAFGFVGQRCPAASRLQAPA